MSALLLIHKDQSRGNVIAREIPFVDDSGQLTYVAEQLADYIVGASLVDSFWETVAAERLGMFLESQAKLLEVQRKLNVAMSEGAVALFK